MISVEYLAGFFDGEGCVNLTVVGQAKTTQLRVSIVNTDLLILNAIHAQYGGRVYARESREGWKMFRAIEWRGEAAYEFLQKIKPFVILKLPQIKLAEAHYEFCNRPRSERCEKKLVVLRNGTQKHIDVLKLEVRQEGLQLKERLHVLNKRGT